MDDKTQVEKQDASLAEAYAAYMIALAARKPAGNTPDLPNAEQQSTWQKIVLDQKTID